MLRTKARQAIFEILDESYFGAANFSVEYGSGNPYWVLIQFLPRPEFSFTIGYRLRNKLSHETIAAPGEKFLSPDREAYENFDQCLPAIKPWIARIREEVIEQNPIARELQAVRRQLEERIDELAEEQDSFFTREEANELQARLGEFMARLAVLSEANSDLSELVNSLQMKIADLQTATEEVNKGTWFRMAGSKLMSAAKTVIRSKEAREFALEAAKKVLLEGPK